MDGCHGAVCHPVRRAFCFFSALKKQNNKRKQHRTETAYTKLRTFPFFVTNKLPEHTTIHWHGQRLPNGMDSVGGLTQPHIPPGQTFVYEFQPERSGTFMYHPHSD